MGFFRNWLSKHGKANRLYHAGLTKAQAGDMEAALEAYNDALQCDATPEVRASALVNRGMAAAKLGRFDEAQSDYQTVLNDPHAPTHIKAAAKDNLFRLRKRHTLKDE